MNDDPTLTLRQGFERFAKANQAILSSRETSEEADRFFRCHDTAHVIFGCDASLFGEGTVKLWTIFGTTLGFWNHVRGYSEADAFSLFRQYSRRHVARNIVSLIANVPRTITRARRMRKRWPWWEYEAYLDMPLAEIRAEFGIETVHPA